MEPLNVVGPDEFHRLCLFSKDFQPHTLQPSLIFSWWDTCNFIFVQANKNTKPNFAYVKLLFIQLWISSIIGCVAFVFSPSVGAALSHGCKRFSLPLSGGCLYISLIIWFVQECISLEQLYQFRFRYSYSISNRYIDLSISAIHIYISAADI